MHPTHASVVQCGVRGGNIRAASAERTIPVRVMNRPGSHAVVNGNRAMWRCVCAYQTLLEAQSGDVAGPTLDSVVVCEHCGKVYFVIPQAISKGSPVEVVELFGLPAA